LQQEFQETGVSAAFLFYRRRGGSQKLSTAPDGMGRRTPFYITVPSAGRALYTYKKEYEKGI
jgi:hypothetical protein